MSEPAPDVDADRDFRTVPDGHRPGTPKTDSLPSDGNRTDGADPDDDPGDGLDDGLDDGAGTSGSGEDQASRAAGMKPSKETGQPGSSSDRPPALDPGS